MLDKQKKLYRRHQRIRAKIFGTSFRPRLSVYRSLKHIYAQVIDDKKGKTLVAASDLELKKLKIKTTHSKEKSIRLGNIAKSFEVGKLIAGKCLKKKIRKIVFDKGGFKYHGQIKSLAEGVREGGIEF